MSQNFLILHTFRLRLLLGLRLSKASSHIGNLSFLIRLLMKIKEALKQAQVMDPNLDSIRRRVESL